ncbi:MAG: hypothetical protein KGR26_14790, partial [Cyanobacteria bacterium REEB65]|nr:hypothetical protein [Cyanobacteria bacterium REEB65]
MDGLSFQTSALSPGTWEFGVRAFDPTTGLEEANVDAAVTIVIGSDGSDQTGLPSAPVGLLAVGQPGASVRLHWTVATSGNPPTGFHVYLGVGSPSYASPVATVAATSGSLSPSYSVLLTGLT